MILTDDDDDYLNIIGTKTTCEKISNEKVNYFVPTKPTVCTFFKPKTKINQNLSDSTKQNGGIFEKIKQSICCDIDNEYRDYKLPKTLPDCRQISSNNSNLTKLDSVKQESFFKCERDLHSSFSTESSSLSNLPTISATYSKSTKSFSDSDNEEQLDNPINSLIVKNVYSLCKKAKPSISTRKTKDSNKSIPLNTNITSCDNSINVVKKGKPSIKKSKKLSPRKTSNKSKKKSSKNINSKSTEETLQRTIDVFKQKTKTKTINTNIIDVIDTQSECSDALTEAMREDINDFDLEPVNDDQSKYSLMQPIIILEQLQIDKISQLKRKNSDDNCRDSLEPLEKKSKLKCSFVSNDSTKTITPDKCIVRKLDDASITTEKTSDSCLLNERNNSHKVIYHSTRDYVENDIIYCFVCKKSSKTICKFHPVTWIPNENIDCPYAEYLINESFEKYYTKHSKQELCTCNQNELDHIQISLPKIFHLKESANSEIGVWTKQKLKQGSIIGPYLGEIMENWKSKKSISCPYKTRRLLKSGNYDELHCLEFAFKSNWMRCINFTNEDALANLKILRYDGKIFFQSTREITANSELLVCDEGDLEIFQLKKKPHFNLSSPSPVDCKNLSSPGKIFGSSSSDNRSKQSDHVKNVSYDAGQKYNKPITEGIGKLLKINPPKTISGILNVCESRYSEEKEIKLNKFSTYLSRLKLRYRDVFRSKIDKEIIEFISESISSNPLLTSSQINKKFAEKFPYKPQFNIYSIKQIISLLDLRPLQGIDNDADNIDREIVEEIVEIFTFNRGLKSEVARKHLSNEFPMKTTELSVETIDKIVKLNHCRIIEEQDAFRVDHDVVKEIKVLMNGGDKSKEVMCEKIKQKFPQREIITLPYIGFLVKKYNLRKNHSIPVKCDEEMKSAIYKLFLEHPDYSAPKINELLRNLFPDKPVLSRHTVAKRIRLFRLSNQS